MDVQAVHLAKLYTMRQILVEKNPDTSKKIKKNFDIYLKQQNLINSTLLLPSKLNNNNSNTRAITASTIYNNNNNTSNSNNKTTTTKIGSSFNHGGNILNTSSLSSSSTSSSSSSSSQLGISNNNKNNTNITNNKLFLLNNNNKNNNIYNKNNISNSEHHHHHNKNLKSRSQSQSPLERSLMMSPMKKYVTTTTATTPTATSASAAINNNNSSNLKYLLRQQQQHSALNMNVADLPKIFGTSTIITPSTPKQQLILEQPVFLHSNSNLAAAKNVPNNDSGLLVLSRQPTQFSHHIDGIKLNQSSNSAAVAQTTSAESVAVSMLTAHTTKLLNNQQIISNYLNNSYNHNNNNTNNNNAAIMMMNTSISSSIPLNELTEYPICRSTTNAKSIEKIRKIFHLNDLNNSINNEISHQKSSQLGSPSGSQLSIGVIQQQHKKTSNKASGFLRSTSSQNHYHNQHHHLDDATIELGIFPTLNKLNNNQNHHINNKNDKTKFETCAQYLRAKRFKTKQQNSKESKDEMMKNNSGVIIATKIFENYVTSPTMKRGQNSKSSSFNNNSNQQLMSDDYSFQNQKQLRDSTSTFEQFPIRIYFTDRSLVPPTTPQSELGRDNNTNAVGHFNDDCCAACFECQKEARLLKKLSEESNSKSNEESIIHRHLLTHSSLSMTSSFCGDYHYQNQNNNDNNNSSQQSSQIKSNINMLDYLDIT